jgi:hypothetical protein
MVTFAKISCAGRVNSARSRHRDSKSRFTLFWLCLIICTTGSNFRSFGESESGVVLFMDFAVR